MGQSQTALLIFSSERPVFLREYATNHYTILPYFLSKLVAEALQSFVAMVVLDLIAYFMIGIQMNFFIFFLLCYALALTTTAVCVLLGSYFTDAKMAMAFFPLVVVPQFYFSGIFIATNLIPVWVRYVPLERRIFEVCWLKRVKPTNTDTNIFFQLDSVPVFFEICRWFGNHLRIFQLRCW